jgi:hypothetical protein
MTDTAKRLAGPESIGNSEETLYTVPAATTAILRNIHIANTTSSAATIKLSIGADAAGTRILSDLSVPANGTYDWSGFLVLAATETLRATGGTNNALTLTASGVEVT